MTYREAVAHGEKVLELSHIADAKTDAWLLLEMGCKIDRKFYYMHMNLPSKNVQNISRCSILWEKRNLWDLSLR